MQHRQKFLDQCLFNYNGRKSGAKSNYETQILSQRRQDREKARSIGKWLSRVTVQD